MNTPHDLSCQEVVELVTDYLEQSLLIESRADVDAHLAICPGCTIYFQQIRQTIEMLRTLAADPLFPETRQELLQVFGQWKAGQQTP